MWYVHDFVYGAVNGIHATYAGANVLKHFISAAYAYGGARHAAEAHRYRHILEVELFWHSADFIRHDSIDILIVNLFFAVGQLFKAGEGALEILTR
jgi:hypothetical protein